MIQQTKRRPTLRISASTYNYAYTSVVSKQTNPQIKTLEQFMCMVTPNPLFASEVTKPSLGDCAQTIEPKSQRLQPRKVLAFMSSFLKYGLGPLITARTICYL